MRRKQALIVSWQANQNAMMQWMMPQWNNASTNQLVSNYISQENQANNQPQALWPTAWNDIPTIE
jgi:hypothetical protein